MYEVFVRNWWKANPAWPNGLEPDSNAHRTYLDRNVPTEDDAQRMCAEHNRTHPPGRLSRKAEYRRR